MPVGQREKSLRSRPSQRSALTLVTDAMVSSEMPRRSRSLRNRGPKVSLSDMMGISPAARDGPGTGSVVFARGRWQIPVAPLAVLQSLLQNRNPVPAYCLSIHARYPCAHSGACCTAGWPIPVEPPLVERS